jgi:50S ribosomal subunit-associated GTPase HflX
MRSPEAAVLAENRLFATLDPTTRRLRFPKEREVIVTDTVGFIRDLPKLTCARAFAATLEELGEADLLCCTWPTPPMPRCCGADRGGGCHSWMSWI